MSSKKTFRHARTRGVTPKDRGTTHWEPGRTRSLELVVHYFMRNGKGLDGDAITHKGAVWKPFKKRTWFWEVYVDANTWLDNRIAEVNGEQICGRADTLEEAKRRVEEESVLYQTEAALAMEKHPMLFMSPTGRAPSWPHQQNLPRALKSK